MGSVNSGIIQEVVRWIDGLVEDKINLANHADELRASNASLAAENERLRDALKPFAEQMPVIVYLTDGSFCPSAWLLNITVGDLRRAAEVLKASEQKEG